MAVIDVQSLLAPVSEEQPCGEPMEDSQDYFALDNASQFKDGGALGGDESEPDWLDVKRQALTLAAVTKDIRVAVHLTAALLRTDGWAGFADGLGLINGYLSRYWDEVYPRLEEDDPFFRVNALLNLIDPQRFISALRRRPVVRSRMAGVFSLRDYLAAAAPRRQENEGEEAAESDQGTVDPNLVRAAFAEADAGELAADAASIDAAVEAFGEIERIVAAKLGTDAPDLTPASKVLRQVKSWMDNERAALSGDSRSDGDAAPAAGAAGPSAGGMPGAINSPEQAIQALDLVADYFRRREPSSPVPLLLERAKRLVRQDFLALMRDLAPDGLSQAQRIFGVEDQ